MNTPATTRLVIADDHPLFRDALRQAVASVVAIGEDRRGGIVRRPHRAAGAGFRRRPDPARPDHAGDFRLLRPDLSARPVSGDPVVVVSASDDIGTIRRSLDFGASGFIPKRFGVETLRDAITKVMDGDVWIPAGHRSLLCPPIPT
jgi:DNA-binding NarL/FixJ family response regulator